MEKIPISCPFCTANPSGNSENPSLKLETEIASRCMTYLSVRVIGHSLHRKSCRNRCSFYQETSNIHNKGRTRRDYPWWILSKKVDQSHSTMELFTEELVFNASAQPYLDNTFSSFTNFLPEQLNLEVQSEVEIWEISYQSRYQFIFFDNELSKVLDFYYLEPGLYPSITDIVEAVNTLIQEDIPTAKAVSHLKCPEELKCLKFFLQMKDLVLHSSVQTWDTFRK